MSLQISKICQLREYKKRRNQRLDSKNMKPALLYLRKYIDENYQHNKANRQENKQNIRKTVTKVTEEVIFKQKKVYECENRKVKQFYFKPTKSFTGMRFQQKTMSQALKPTTELNGFLVEPLAKKTQRSSVEVKQKKQRRTIVSNTGENSPAQSVAQENKKFTKNIPQHKQVRFILSPPVQNTPHFGATPQGIQTSKEIPKKSEHIIQVIQQQEAPLDQLDHVITLQIDANVTPKFTKSEQFKLSSKSMTKLGYNTLFDYLNEMKKCNKIKKKQIKEAFYYPLACMTPQINQNQQFQQVKKLEKFYLQSKLQKFYKQISVHDGFSGKTVQLKNFTSKTKGLRSKPKSNFSKVQYIDLDDEKPLTDQLIEKKSKKFLLEYEQIVMCNCANKKYFSYRLSSNTDYNSFFRFTTPLLDSKPQKNNNYLIENKDSDSLGLYFCCLINSSLGVREGFFWIAKPIQYYRKDKVIKVIDDFLFDVKAFQVFQSDRLWIVDNHGRNSHIMKSLLTKCNDIRNSQQSNTSTKKKARVSKRISLSMSHQPNTETPEMFMSLLANFAQFNQTALFVKKERNNISTTGAFKLIYEPRQSHYEKKKTNYQSTF